MPQLPPVAAAVFVFSLLAVIITTTIVVQIGSRRRRMRLAEMVRATAPVPRPAVSPIDPLPVGTPAPLRGRPYRAAEQQGSFRAFEERSGRGPAPGRPARRLAAQVAHAAPAVRSPERPAGPRPLRPTPEAEADPAPGNSAHAASPVIASHMGLSEWTLDAEVAPARHLPHAEVAATVVAPSVSAAPLVEEAPEPAWAPQVMVLPPRPGAAALPGLMTREVTLGDAARALRGALPGALTMTDGRHLRRAVAVGAATSVVAAAFAIRGRRR